ncbi:exosortase-associated EpsI family protein [Verrucomicrobiaceae bacterium N1E253]|uniref:Exosortase-associated EpsI family protein n=1 Tax=Oceaniferula marina TaxID=2748318 RepID=A0A851GKE2_9BACT|nr:exosortase-associated EpsI family protein [Oceaniferula marina]NWK55190.1 exosortase-associated EpsI family protein [Oceaniferula marina]
MNTEPSNSCTPELQHSRTPAVVRRLYILACLLALGFSMIWLLPKSGEMKPSRLKRPLPMQFGSIWGKSTEVTGEELKILAKDTEFERAQYMNRDFPTRPPVEASVVFSGKDLNNSIHRPERCLRSQGWNFTKERKVMVKGAMPDGADMPFREIVCAKPVQLKNGEVVEVMRVQYYTFFGHTAVTEDHYGRTLQDMKDRLFKGYDQQWAYATFSMPVYNQSHVDLGMVHPSNVYTLEESEAILAEFIQKLAPLVVE